MQQNIKKTKLLLIKEVDWSLVNWWMTLPIEFHQVMGCIGNRLLKRGEKKDVKLVINENIYDAKIVNEKYDIEKYPNRAPIIQLRYKKDVATVVQQMFKETSDFLYQYHRETRKSIKLDDSLKAYIHIYATNKTDTFYIECMSTETKSLDINNVVSCIDNEISQLNISGESKDAIVKIRVNQGVFRDYLLKRYNKCCLCDVSNVKLLIASHIKPWSKSEPEEKLDIDNGFLMCPNHDRLFDKGWISFEDNGNILISSQLSEEDCKSTKVKKGTKVDLTEGNKKYLKFHRDNIFLA